MSNNRPLVLVDKKRLPVFAGGPLRAFFRWPYSRSGGAPCVSPL